MDKFSPNASRTGPPLWRRIAVAVLAVAIGAALRMWPLGMLGTRVTFITFYPAVIVAALYGGLEAGLGAAALSAFLADYFLMEPVGSLTIRDPADWIAMAVFLLSCATIAWTAEALRRAHARADEAEAQARLADERRRADEALREAHQRLNLHVDHSPLAVVEWDGGFHITRWAGEAEHVFGWTAAEVLGKRIDELPWVYEEDLPSVSAVMEDIISGKRPSNINKNRNVRKDGAVIHCEWYNTSIRDSAGNLVSVFSQVLDVTERNRLIEELARYELLSQNIRDIVLYVRREDGRILEANAAAAAAYGYTREELKRLTLQDLRAPGTEAPAADRMAALDAHSLLFETAHRRKDGAAFPVEVSSQAATIGGAPTLIQVVRDITERREIEDALRENEERLRLFVEYAPAAVAMFDREMRYLVASRKWVEAHRLGDVHILGRCHYDVFPEIPEHWKERHQRCLAGAVERCDEEAFPRADGSLDWVRWENHPWRNAQGEIGGIIIFSEVITDRKRDEQALRESEARWRALLESAPQGIIASDEGGRIVVVNARTEEVFGYGRDELVGQPLELLLPERFREAHAVHLREYFAHPRTRPMALGMELWGRKKYGTEFPLEVSLSFVEQGGTSLALALMTDITERKQAEERLRQTQKLESLGLLAGGVAHDFNNLLVGVIGNASLAQELLPPGNPAAELLDAVIKTGEQAAHLTRQMLAYSGKGRFVVEALDLSALIPEIGGLVRPSISKKIALHFDLEEDLPPIEADRGQIQQVFMNLVLNAAEAIGSRDGLISVRTGVQNVDDVYVRLHPEAAELKRGEYVLLEVRDTGCGMSDATKAKIFDPFFSTKFTGRGLGLAAVAGIVRGHKGVISVTSVPGQGSCFTVLFPATARRGKEADSPVANTALRGAGVVLVVDDEPLVRGMAQRSLELHGYAVLVAENGRAAIDLFKRYPGEIALVVLDLSMPDLSGEETLPELRRIRPGVKVVVSSGYSEAEAMTMFQGQPVAGFLQKPYTSTRLAEKVKVYVG